MGFKSFAQYQDDKNGDFFVLPNDKDYADVVFLYRSTADVLIADVHYIATAAYKGYAHCCGAGCPACSYGERGLKVENKLFIPLYNIARNRIEFWDRSPRFEQKLQMDVFKNWPDPSQAVFRITRNGLAGSPDTKYDIDVIGRNSSMPYDKILSDFGITLPDGYSKICREMTAAEMSAAFSSNSSANVEEYEYVPTPRGASVDPSTLATPTVPVPEYVPGNDAVPDPVPSTFEGIANDPVIEPVESIESSDDIIDNVKF